MSRTGAKPRIKPTLRHNESPEAWIRGCHFVVKAWLWKHPELTIEDVHGILNEYSNHLTAELKAEQ